MEILVLSDTHGFLDNAVMAHARASDEIWHAGDFGSPAVSESLAAIAPLRGVYGNVDGGRLRQVHPLHQRFSLEGVAVAMTHIGGYPGHYAPGIREMLRHETPTLFISGHSHIVKVMRDPALANMLHINPGAAGREGFHRMRTVVKLRIGNGRIFDVRVVELGPR